MAHQSPYSKWVFDEWEEIVCTRDKLPLEERFEMWRSLHQKTFADERWAVGIDDASLVASSGRFLAMEKRDFLAARDICRQFLAHPDLDRNQVRFDHAIFYHWEAVADILSGNVGEGISRLRRDLAVVKDDRSYFIGLVSSLIELVSTQGLENQADPLIAELVDEVVVAFQPQVQPSRDLPSIRTNGDLENDLERYRAANHPAS